MFTTTELADGQIIVEGTDVRGNEGQMVVNGSQWFALKRRTAHSEAVTRIDDAIAELVAPIQAAVDAANETLRLPELDPLLYIVEQEEKEGVPFQQKITTKLNHDSVILRAIETGQDNRLIWVNGVLVLTAQASTPQPPAVEDDEFVDPAPESEEFTSSGEGYVD